VLVPGYSVTKKLVSGTGIIERDLRRRIQFLLTYNIPMIIPNGI
jgi:hypothetical protein